MKKGSRRKYSITAKIYDKRGRLLSSGTNSYTKTHPYQYKIACSVGRKDAIFLHAEIDALLRLKSTAKAHKIYIERYGHDGTPLPAAPCTICTKALESAGIKIIEFT